MDLGEPPPKRKCKLQCIICQKKLTGEVVKNPSDAGLISLIQACELRQDCVAERVLPIKEQILSRIESISFHKSCRGAYTSKSNLKWRPKGKVLDAATEGTSSLLSAPPARFTRGHPSSQFDIRRQCLICGLSSKRGEKLTQVVTGSGDATRERVIQASSARKDDVISLRMVKYPDLTAHNAKYHRSCYSHYISERNVNAAIRRCTSAEKPEDLLFRKLVEHIEGTVLSNKKMVTSLSKLKDQYEEYSSTESKGASPIYSWTLKKRLKNYFGDKLVFIHQSGKSDIVCSSDITVGTALRKATELQDQLQNEDDVHQTQYDCDSTLCQDDEVQILHKAAGILRHCMADISYSGEYYFPSTEISKKKCAEFVPDVLYNFISWLTDANSYEDVSSCSNQPFDKSNMSIVAICHDLIGLSRSIVTPVTLGLGVYIHHEFGSRKLLDDLHAMGHSISYDEVRRFLTSVAKDQESHDTYIPKGLRSADDPNFEMIDAAIDNFDQNEETLDGKHTTHALAAVIYQRCPPTPQEQSGILRIKRKSLNDVPIIDDFQRYNKPAKRPEPTMISDSSIVEIEEDKKTDAAKRDYLWLIGRHRPNIDGQQQCPSWTGFNSIVSSADLPLSTVRYLPFLNASPSDLNTIYTMLLRLVKIANKLGQPHIFVTADMAIYSKAQQILWANLPELNGKVTMRIGGMHMTMAFMACLGTIFGAGGLLSLLVDSGVYAEATAKQMLQGKQYARGVRGIKLVHEALYRLLFQALESWLGRQGRNITIRTADEKICNLCNAISINDFDKAQVLANELEDEDIPALMTVLEEFRAVGRAESKTFAYWDNFLIGGDVLLHMLRAEREGNFDLHLQATSEAVPWFYAAGRNQYKKFAPVYIAEMMELKTAKPESYRHLQNGGFVVRQTSRHGFNAVSTDQALEQTINKDGKSKGGVIGLTKRKTAVTRWLTTRHIAAEYVEAFTSKEGFQVSRPHEELGKARRERDEKDVTSIVENAACVQSPFDLDTVPSDLTNIVTGQVASKEVQESLHNFLERGEAKNREFVTNRVTTMKTKSFWETEPRLKIKTFSDMKKPILNNDRHKLILDSEVLFRRLLVVSKQQKVNLENVLTHELSATSPTLFHDDGSMRKTAKSDLTKKLEERVHSITGQLTGSLSTAYIIDGMALIQGIPDTVFLTFRDLAGVVFKLLMNSFSQNQGVDSVAIVFDRYDQALSLKAAERRRRGETQQAGFAIQGNRQVPNYREFLKVSGNKAALAGFVSEHIVDVAPQMLLGHQKIFLAGGFPGGETAKLVTATGAATIPSLFSSQEEADTRMLLHAIDLSSTHDRLIVRSDDTDVLVLLLYYCSKNMLSKFVYMLAGHNTPTINRQRYIPIHTMTTEHGMEFCLSLPAAHALTGCDTTSSFYQTGKRTACTKLEQHVKKKNPSLTTFGIQNDLEADISSARSYVLSFYGKKAETCSSLDQLRYVLASTTDKPASQLPPTEDAFKQHVLRARYQTRIWCQSHVAHPSPGSPIGNGWYLSDGVLEPKIYTKEPAPMEVRDLIHMYCTDTDCSQSRKCLCLENHLHCTEFCGCQGDCQNTTSSIDVDSDDDSLD